MKEGFNLGNTLGLTHSKECKDAYRTWNKTQDPKDKALMVKVKSDCALCKFKKQVRQEQIKKEKVNA